MSTGNLFPLFEVGDLVMVVLGPRNHALGIIAEIRGSSARVELTAHSVGGKRQRAEGVAPSAWYAFDVLVVVEATEDPGGGIVPPAPE